MLEFECGAMQYACLQVLNQTLPTKAVGSLGKAHCTHGEKKLLLVSRAATGIGFRVWA